MSTDANPADSSPAAESPLDAGQPVVTAAQDAVAKGDFSAFRAATRTASTDAPAASSAATPAEQAASTEVTDPPASEPGKPRKTAEDRKRELAADVEAGLKRRADLRAEIAAEEARLAALRTPPSKSDALPASSPATAAFPSYDDYRVEHPEAQYEDYLDARSDFRAEQRFAALEAQKAQTQERQTRQQSIAQRDAKFKERVDAAAKADPEFFQNLSPDVGQLFPISDLTREQDPQTGRFTGRFVDPRNRQVVPGDQLGYFGIADELLSSDLAPQLMRHFTDHPEDLHRIAKLEPRELLKEMGKLEARLSEAKPATPAPKLVTDAPAATTLGKSPTTPADPVKAAVANGDFSSFRRALRADRAAGAHR